MLWKTPGFLIALCLALSGRAADAPTPDPAPRHDYARQAAEAAAAERWAAAIPLYRDAIAHAAPADQDALRLQLLEALRQVRPDTPAADLPGRMAEVRALAEPFLLQDAASASAADAAHVLLTYHIGAQDDAAAESLFTVYPALLTTRGPRSASLRLMAGLVAYRQNNGELAFLRCLAAAASSPTDAKARQARELINRGLSRSGLAFGGDAGGGMWVCRSGSFLSFGGANLRSVDWSYLDDKIDLLTEADRMCNALTVNELRDRLIVHATGRLDAIAAAPGASDLRIGMARNMQGRLAQMAEDDDAAAACYQRALTTLRRVPADSPDHTAARCEMAVSLLQTGQDAAARDLLQAVVQDAPADPAVARAHVQVGQHYWRVQDYAAAGDQFQALRDHFPEHDLAGKAGLLVGQCRIRTQDYAAAVTALQLLPTVTTDSELLAEAAYWTGDTQRRLGDLAASAATLRRLVTDHPDTKWAKMAQALLLGADYAEPR